MTKKPRVRLSHDFADEFGQRFNEGQTGTVCGSVSGGRLVIDFDGYDEARIKDAERKAMFGEGYNVTPWLALVPKSLLEELDDESPNNDQDAVKEKP